MAGLCPLAAGGKAAPPRWGMGLYQMWPDGDYHQFLSQLRSEEIDSLYMGLHLWYSWDYNEFLSELWQ